MHRSKIGPIVTLMHALPGEKYSPESEEYASPGCLYSEQIPLPFNAFSAAFWKGVGG